MITHASDSIPSFAERWDPSDNDWVWISWENKLGGESIATSTWVLPAGWTEEDSQADQTVQDSDGTSYANSNGVRLSTTKTTGTHKITNRVTFSGSRSLDRSVFVTVKEL